MTADQDNHILDATYYMELPQDTVVILDYSGNPFQLTRYHAPDDLAVFTPDKVHTQNLSRVSFSDPIDLKESAFNMTAAIDSVDIHADLEKCVLKLATPTIKKHVFDTICPDYSHKPHAMVENIKQWTKDSEGNVRVQNIKENYARFMLAARPFVKSKTLPVDLASVFIQNMHNSHKMSFKETYPMHL
jgi:hypothetical protein